MDLFDQFCPSRQLREGGLRGEGCMAVCKPVLFQTLYEGSYY